MFPAHPCETHWVHNTSGTSKLEKPIIWAMVKIDDVHGGFVHRLDELDPEDVKIGLRVEATFKEKKNRIGSMLDIKYFKPLE